MDGMLSNKTITKEATLEIAHFLDDHQGGRTVALYVGEKSSFTDYFVITTARSQGHLRGLVGQVYEVLDRFDLSPRGGKRRPAEDGWVLLDCGPIVVHLMLKEPREFYDLERLWFGSDVLFEGNGSGNRNTADPVV